MNISSTGKIIKGSSPRRVNRADLKPLLEIFGVLSGPSEGREGERSHPGRSDRVVLCESMIAVDLPNRVVLCENLLLDGWLHCT